MKLGRIVRIIFLIVINILSLSTAIYIFYIVEINSKQSTLGEFALGLAPTVWGFDIETPSIFLNDYILREDHSEITIIQDDDSLFCKIINNETPVSR